MTLGPGEVIQQYQQHNFERITLLFLELIINLKNNILQMSNKRGQPYNKWSQYEDGALLKLINQNGCKKWNLISKLMKQKAGIPNRTGKQCRERYLNNLKQENKKFVWDDDDDRKLFELFGRLGTKWCQIVKHFPNNCDSFIKNRFYSLTRKSIRKMCKYCSTKTTSLNIYNVKPVTIAFILTQGQAEHHEQSTFLEIFQKQQQQQQFLQNNCKTISQMIKYFIFKKNGKKENQPQKKTVLEAINKIMQIDLKLSSPRDKYKNKQEQQYSIIEGQISKESNSFQQKNIIAQKKRMKEAYKASKDEVKQLSTRRMNKLRNIQNYHKQTDVNTFSMISSQFYLQSLKDIYAQGLQCMTIPQKTIMFQLVEEDYHQEDSFVFQLNDQTKNRLIFKVHH